MANPSGLTPAQRAAFFRALQAASIELGYDTPEARETYRKEVMREEAGVEHLADLSRTTGFDRVMRRFAADSETLRPLPGSPWRTSSARPL